MIPRLISSLQHPLVKKLVNLRESRAYRQQQKALLIVGRTVIAEVATRHKIKTLISTTPLPIAAETAEIATEQVLQKIIGHKTDDLVAAEIELPPQSDLKNCGLVVVLDELGDPGNVGTIFRTALALGWDGVFVIQGSADPYNDKALRASRAASLFLPWREGSWSEAREYIESTKRLVVVADTKGTPLTQMKYSRPLILILGHETRGPSEEALKLGEPITIPMKCEMESLNVSSAASILLYHIQEAL